MKSMKTGPINQDQCATPTMGGWGGDQPLLVIGE